MKRVSCRNQSHPQECQEFVVCSFAGITEKDRGQNGQELVIVGYTCACVMRPCEGVDVCASM